MSKKKVVLISSALTTLSICGLVMIFSNKTNTAHGTEHGPSCAWNHYDEVEAKTGKHGSKEFWACCTHGGHTLEEPLTGTITDCGAFSGTYFDNLDSEDDRYIPNLGSTPIFEGNTVRYGIYPQTNVNDPDLLLSLNNLVSVESNGWYLLDDEYYAKVVASPDYDPSEFDDGSQIVSGQTYWFKCEPIVWDILDENSGEYFLLSKVLLDACEYYHSYDTRVIGGKTIYPNNYMYSDLRAWLNSDFFNSAFSLNNSYVKTTLVDNSASTTDDLANPYVCDNTEDKVFLPSYKDYMNSAYGFPDSDDETITRSCKTTDWARARGSYYSSYLTIDYVGVYFFRSPNSEDCDSVWYSERDGYLDDDGVRGSENSVRPAITLSLN